MPFKDPERRRAYKRARYRKNEENERKRINLKHYRNREKYLEQRRERFLRDHDEILAKQRERQRCVDLVAQLDENSLNIHTLEEMF